MADLHHEAEAADADMYRYHEAMSRGHERAALAIEEAWGLVGYPPEIVSGVLFGVSQGQTVGDTLDALLDPEHP